MLYHAVLFIMGTMCLKPPTGEKVAGALSAANIPMTGGGTGVAPGNVRRARSALRRAGLENWASGLTAAGRFT